MSELSDFLLARIVEDEDEARAHPDSALFPSDDGAWDGGLYTWVGRSGAYGGGITSARLKAECEAKRRIIDLAESVAESKDIHADAWTATRLSLRALALPYADHPEFREEWAL